MGAVSAVARFQSLDNYLFLGGVAVLFIPFFHFFAPFIYTRFVQVILWPGRAHPRRCFHPGPLFLTHLLYTIYTRKSMEKWWIFPKRLQPAPVTICWRGSEFSLFDFTALVLWPAGHEHRGARRPRTPSFGSWFFFSCLNFWLGRGLISCFEHYAALPPCWHISPCFLYLCLL